MFEWKFDFFGESVVHLKKWQILYSKVCTKFTFLFVTFYNLLLSAQTTWFAFCPCICFYIVKKQLSMREVLISLGLEQYAEKAILKIVSQKTGYFHNAYFAIFFLFLHIILANNNAYFLQPY